MKSQPGEVRGDPARLVVGRPDGQAALVRRGPGGAAEPDHAPPVQVQLEAGPGQHALQVLSQGRGGAGELADRCEHDAGAQCGAQRVGDDRCLAECLRAKQAQAVGEHPEPGLGLVEREHAQRAAAQDRADQAGVMLVLAGAAQQEGGDGAQTFEDLDGLKRVPVAGGLGLRLGAGEHKHSQGTFCSSLPRWGAVPVTPRR